MRNIVKLKDFDGMTAHLQGYGIRNLPIELLTTASVRLVNHITECTLKNKKGKVVAKAYAICSRPINIPHDQDGNQVFDVPSRKFGRKKALERALELFQNKEERFLDYKFGVDTNLLEYLPMDRDFAEFEVYKDEWNPHAEDFLNRYEEDVDRDYGT